MPPAIRLCTVMRQVWAKDENFPVNSGYGLLRIFRSIVIVHCRMPPTVSVVLPTYNRAALIGRSIQSVLNQSYQDFELIVIDDGSNDETAEVVAGFRDQRLAYIPLAINTGAGAARNVGIRMSKGRFLSFQDSDDEWLPNKLARQMSIFEQGATRLGVVYSDQQRILKDGTTREHPAPAVISGRLVNTAIQFYQVYKLGIQSTLIKREYLDAAGYFNEALRALEDLELFIRLSKRCDFYRIPEPLVTYYETKGLSTDLYANWSARRLLLKLYYKELLSHNPTFFMKECLWLCKTRAGYAWWGAVNLLWHTLYEAAGNFFPQWPISITATKKKDKRHGKRIGYFIGQYHVLSQTSIQRELAALGDSGLSVLVIADILPDRELPDVNTPGVSVQYLCPMDEKILWRYRRYFFFKNPLACVNLFLYVICHNYNRNKNFDFDRLVFSKAIYLAGLLKETGTGLIHSPWADDCAFISLLASRLLGIPYSVQARAHDVHGKAFLYGLGEKFNNADFVITNSEYNAAHIKSLASVQTAGKINVVYEGLNLDQFPVEERKNGSSALRVLSVARLIERKGLIYLLKACKILKGRGHAFTCEIVGESENPLFMNYHASLKKLHQDLGLEDCVFFRGAQPFLKVLEGYRQADIFVLPCVVGEDGSRDIIPNSLIEAMAMKLPVISTNITAIPEIVQNGVSGILIPPNDEQALAEALIKLIENAPLRRRLGENARRKVEERFDIHKNIAGYANLFDGNRGSRC